ncbi:MAG: GNAT family N-acetyltransferase [Bacilli bacterium]
MTSEKILLACIRKADYNFNLIQDGDKILVGLSGGKDSYALIKILNRYSKFKNKNFEFTALFIDLGFGSDANPLIEFCKKENINLIVQPAQDVAKILNQHKKNNLLPCSICSRMKKAIINQAAHKYGANKVAFAHHADDAIETLFMNMTYGGRFATFAPKMHLDKEDITFIRPFIYAREKDIIAYSKKEKFPILSNQCGNDKKTKREEFKIFLDDYYKKYPAAKTNFVSMLLNQEKMQLWFDDFVYGFDDGCYVKKVSTPSDMARCYLIRKEVFMKEQSVPLDDEIDIDDTVYTHYLFFTDQNIPVGTMRVLIDKDKHIALFGRIAILKKYRGNKYGQRMVCQVEKLLSQRITPLTVKLAAQSRAVDFYKTIGYRITSDKFVEAGIEHYRMEKFIKFPILDKKKIY